MAERSSYVIANEINKVLAEQLQGQLRCGICCSTLKKPIIPNCNHTFCGECLNQCFEKKSPIECPICRAPVKKRSCVSSDNLQALVDAYLQHARNFKRDVKEHAIAIPRDEIFLESQAPISTQAMDSPMRSFQPQPLFRMPEKRVRKRRIFEDEEEKPGLQPNKRPVTGSKEVVNVHASKKPRLAPVKEEVKKPRLAPVKEEVTDIVGANIPLLPVKVEPIKAELVNTNDDEDEEDILLLDDPPVAGQPEKPHLGFGFPEPSRQGGKINNKQVISPQGPRTTASPANEGKWTPPTLMKPGKAHDAHLARINSLLQRKPLVSSSSNKIGNVFPPKDGMWDASAESSPQSQRLVALLKKHEPIRCMEKPTSNKQTVNEALKTSSTGLPDLKAKITPKKRTGPPLTPDKRVVNRFDGLIDAVNQFKASGGKTPLEVVFELVPGLTSLLLANQDELISKLDLKIKPDPSPASVCSKCKAESSTTPEATRSQKRRQSIEIAKSAHSPTSGPVVKLSKKCVPSASSDDDCIVLDDDTLNSSTVNHAARGLNLTNKSHEKENHSLDDSFDEPVVLTDSMRKSRIGTYIPEPKRDKSKSMIIAVSHLQSKNDENLIHEFQYRFQDVIIVDDVTEDCTHLVMFNSVDRTFTRRSLKYVCAIAYECEVLCRDWMLECVRSHKLLKTHNFTIDRDYGLSPAIDPAWIRVRYGAPIFTNMFFYLPETYTDCNQLPYQTVLALIKACGGKIVTNLWEVSPPDCKIIFAPFSNQVNDAKRYEVDTKVPVITADWILDAISEWRLPKSTDEYRVYRPPRVC